MPALGKLICFRIDRLELLPVRQLRKKKTGQKGPWKNMGNKQSSIVSPELKPGSAVAGS